MKREKVVAYILSALIALAVGGLSGLLSMEGMEIYAQTVSKPSLTPPGWLFPVVWTVLYILMGISSGRIWLAEPSLVRSTALNLYVTQLVVNFFWSLIFFNAQAFGAAAAWLFIMLALVVLMILQFWKVNKAAALLLIPYYIWLCFAAYLNLGVWYLNS